MNAYGISRVHKYRKQVKLASADNLFEQSPVRLAQPQMQRDRFCELVASWSEACNRHTMREIRMNHRFSSPRCSNFQLCVLHQRWPETELYRSSLKKIDVPTLVMQNGDDDQVSAMICNTCLAGYCGS